MHFDFAKELGERPRELLFEHDISFKSAFAEYSENGEPEFTNFTDGFKGTLDYIFYSPGFKPLEIDELFTDIEDGAPLPQSGYPSDHIALSASFAFSDS